MAILDKHAILEKSPTLLLTASLLVVTIGGLVEIAPSSGSRTPSKRSKGCGPTRRSN
jgi:cbb3-type cytochrome oxidase cytochrome c subunit